MNNDFVNGGIVLVLVGVLFTYGRYLLELIFKFIKNKFFVEIDITNNNQKYNDITLWLQKYAHHTNRVTLRPDTQSPAPGFHYFYWNKKISNLIL